MNSVFIFGSIFLIATASVYFIRKTGKQHILYSIVILVSMAQLIGVLYRILHLTGAYEFLILGFTGTLTGAVLLVWKALRNEHNQLYLNKLMAGLLIILQLAMVVIWGQNSVRIGQLLHYPITALLATVLLNGQAENKGERNMMFVFLLESILFIIIELILRR